MAEKKRKIEDVTLVNLKEYSAQLARKIQDSGYLTEHILYVERAGLFVAYEIAKHLKCSSITGIHAKRGGNSLKSKFRIILRWLPKRVTDLMRRIEEKSNIHNVKSERNVYIEGQFPPKRNNILLVDDAVDTGNSLKAVVNFLVSKGYHQDSLHSIVLTTTRKHPEYRADISLFNGISFAFPWSYTSKEYHRSWEFYNKYKSDICKQACQK